MTRYLLDTNVLSTLVRAAPETLLSRIDGLGKDAIYTSVIAAGELRFGAVKKGSAKFAAEIEAVLSRVSIASLKPNVTRFYASLRHHLEKKGTIIGTNDLWIAAHALADGSVMVTANRREFLRVPGLQVETWV